MLGISGDSPFSHAEFHKRDQLPFPLLSDVHRKVIRQYDVLDEERNVAYRSTVIIDRDSRLRWSQAGDRQMTRSGAEILRVLELIRTLRSSGHPPAHLSVPHGGVAESLPPPACHAAQQSLLPPDGVAGAGRLGFAPAQRALQLS